MQVLTVAGPSDSGKTTLVERLTARLTEHGRVATVKHLDCEPSVDTAGKDTARHRRAGAAETYGIETDGTWFATGADHDLDALVDDLAGRCDYLLVEGYAEARLPTVALGGREHAGETVVAATDADAVDVDALYESIEALEPVETLASLVDRARRSPTAQDADAVATVTGRVRMRTDPDDLATGHLTFEEYDGVAERMAAIRSDLEARDRVHEVRLHHRAGLVRVDEDVVYVVVLAGHREEAFGAVAGAIDRLEAEIPTFETEFTVEDEFRAHERP